MSDSSHVHSAAVNGYAEVNTDAYEAGRPDYKAECVDLLLQHTLPSPNAASPLIRLIDLGCGTGKFTRPLVDALDRLKKNNNTYQNTQFNLTAVDPVQGMLAKFRKINPSIPIVEGSGESLPFESNSLDCIYVAQAFHWFANEKSVKELHRVLVKGGWLGLIWNTRNTEVDWVRKLDDIIDEYYGPDVPRQQTRAWQSCFKIPSVSTLFGPLNEHVFQDVMVQEGGEQLILDRVLSISVIAELPSDARERVADRIRELLRTHPQTRDSSTYRLPYRTDVYWIQKL